MHSINNDKDCFLIAGTAANVISFLALMGVDSYFLQPHYRGRDGVWLNLAMEQRKIKVIDYSSSSNDAPRIIEHLDKGKHSFKTVCPLCGKKMLELKLPQVNHVKKLGINISEYNLFFYDRISDGIKWIAELNVRGWNFYEPNSFRNYEVFCTNSKTADILKISKERCSDKYIERLKNDLNLGKTMLFIVSLGAEGVKYSYKNAEGKMSDWVYIGSNCSDFVVDSTGAGDWMTAVFMYELMKFYPNKVTSIDKEIIKLCMQKAEKVASYTCRYLGAQGIVENREALNYIGNVLECHMDSVHTDYSANREVCAYCYK